MTKIGHVPHQKNMSDEQEQTFTNGINKGRKLERTAITGLLNRDDLVPRINTPQGNWVHLDTLLTRIKELPND